jgi:hypothetical protein
MTRQESISWTLCNGKPRKMKTNNQKVSSKILSLPDKVIRQLMMFNKCTYARAVCMYKEMLQIIADYYLLESKVSSKILSNDEIKTFSHDIFNAYGLIEEQTNQLTKQLQS